MIDLTQKPDTDALAKQYAEVANVMAKILTTSAQQVIASISSKSEEDPFVKLLEKYQSYAEQRKAIEKKFDDDIAAMKAKSEDEKYKANITEAERLKQEAINALNTSIAQREGEFTDWANQILKMGLNSLMNALATAKLALMTGNDKLSDEERAMLEAKITALEKQIEAKQRGTSSSKQSVTAWKNTAKVMGDVATMGRSIISSFDGMDDGLKGVLTSFVTVADGAAQMANAIAAITGAIGAAEKASGILLIISAAATIIGGLFSWIGGEDPVEKTRKEFVELNDELVRLQRVAQINSWKGTIFGQDEWKNASINMDAYVRALGRYNETLDKIKTRGQEQYADLPGMGPGHVKTDKANLEKIPKTWETAKDSLYNMQVQTRHSTWFRSAKYDSLGKLLPDMFKNDELNMVDLKNFQGSKLYNKLTKDNRKLIDDLVAEWEIYGKALDEVKSYLTDIFGELGNSMSDALVDAFANGTDAAKAFTDSVSDMLENLATDMIYSATLGPLFENAQADMLAAMGDTNLSKEEKFKRYAEILKGVTQDALTGQADFNRLLEEYQRIAEEAGLELFKPDEVQQQEAASKGFETMSQETGNELNGRFTVMTDIMAKQLELQTVMKDASLSTADAAFNIRDLVGVANNHLSAIRSNTNELYDIRTELRTIRENTAYLK